MIAAASQGEPDAKGQRFHRQGDPARQQHPATPRAAGASAAWAFAYTCESGASRRPAVARRSFENPERRAEPARKLMTSTPAPICSQVRAASAGAAPPRPVPRASHREGYTGGQLSGQEPAHRDQVIAQARVTRRRISGDAGPVCSCLRFRPCNAGPVLRSPSVAQHVLRSIPGRKTAPPFRRLHDGTPFRALQIWTFWEDGEVHPRRPVRRRSGRAPLPAEFPKGMPSSDTFCVNSNWRTRFATG